MSKFVFLLGMSDFVYCLVHGVIAASSVDLFVVLLIRCLIALPVHFHLDVINLVQ